MIYVIVSLVFLFYDFLLSSTLVAVLAVVVVSNAVLKEYQE